MTYRRPRRMARRSAGRPGVKIIWGVSTSALFRGRAHEVWEWLRETGRLTECCDAPRVVEGDVTMHYACGKVAR